MNSMPSRELQAWTRRVLVANGFDSSDTRVHWLGLHMERFVGFARLNCENFDLPTAIAAYRAVLSKDLPPPSEFLLGQIRQALVSLSRGVERWRWATAPGAPNTKHPAISDF